MARVCQKVQRLLAAIFHFTYAAASPRRVRVCRITIVGEKNSKIGRQSKSMTTQVHGKIRNIIYRGPSGKADKS